jgi:hypothetical protein
VTAPSDWRLGDCPTRLGAVRLPHLIGKALTVPFGAEELWQVLW